MVALGITEEFDEYYTRLVNEEILQLLGRPRSHRYPDKQFKVFMVTPEHTDLSWLTGYGITVVTKDAFEVNPAAGTQKQFTRFRIIQAILTGQTTQTNIAEWLKCTQQAISKTLSEAGISLGELADRLACFTSTTGSNKDPSRDSCSPQELYQYFAWFFELDPIAIAQDAIETIKRIGWDGFARYLENGFPPTAQACFYSVLWSLLDTGLPPAT